MSDLEFIIQKLDKAAKRLEAYRERLLKGDGEMGYPLKEDNGGAFKSEVVFAKNGQWSMNRPAHDVHVQFTHNKQEYNHTFRSVQGGHSAAVSSALDHLRNKLPGAQVTRARTIPGAKPPIK